MDHQGQCKVNLSSMLLVTWSIQQLRLHSQWKHSINWHRCMIVLYAPGVLRYEVKQCKHDSVFCTVCSYLECKYPVFGVKAMWYSFNLFQDPFLVSGSFEDTTVFLNGILTSKKEKVKRVALLQLNLFQNLQPWLQQVPICAVRFPIGGSFLSKN